MTGRTELFRSVLVNVGCRVRGPTGGRIGKPEGFFRHFRPATAHGPPGGEDTEIGLIAHRLGWELWYVPDMQMGHIIPPARLTPQYLDNLIAQGGHSAPWLDYLRGKEPKRSRWFYFLRWAWYKRHSIKMAILAQLRGSTDQAPRLRFWSELYRNIASGYWELARKYPFTAFESAVSAARDGERS